MYRYVYLVYVDQLTDVVMKFHIMVTMRLTRPGQTTRRFPSPVRNGIFKGNRQGKMWGAPVPSECWNDGLEWSLGETIARIRPEVLCEQEATWMERRQNDE